jgi:hypothetical protein
MADLGAQILVLERGYVIFSITFIPNLWSASGKHYCHS